MRNLRKLTAVVIAIALVLTSMATAFAASTYEFEAQASVLKDLGIWQGNDSGDLMLGKELSRAEGAVLVLKTVLGKTEADMDAADTSGIADFADADKVPAWAQKWVALAVEEGVIKGSNNNLNAAAPLLGKDLASMFMNALGFASENKYAEAVELLAAKATVTPISSAIAADEALLRDSATAIVFDALTAKAKDATDTVIVKYVGSNASLKAVAEAAGLIVAAPTALEVESVTATNLRELVIKFTNAPAAAEAKKTANYKIGTNNPDAVTLSEDGKTVTLRTSNANKMGNYGTVDLTIVKAVGFDADKEIKGIAVKDITPPSALSVKATGPKNIKVALSEPVDESVTSATIASKLKIDGGYVAIDSSKVTVSGLELSIETYSDLSVGEHKIQFETTSTIVDNAGYPLQGATLTFNYVKDESPLSFTVVESNEKTVTVQFNKALKSGSFDGNVNVELTHTYNTPTNRVFANVAVTSTDNQKFVIAFQNPFPPGATTVYLNYGIDSGAKIEDNFGNKLAATSFTVTTTPDLTKPTATAKFVDATHVEITYSENVDKATAENAGNYTLKTGNDTIAISAAVQKADDAKVVTLTTATMNGGTYTLTVKNVKDTSVAANVIDETTLTFTGTDKVPPVIESATLVAATKVKVKFSEVMDAASITDKSVYKVNSVALGTDDKVEAVDGNKAALITFKTAPGAFTLNVARVKDLAGNWTETFDKPFNISATVATVGVKEVQVTGKNSIKLVIEDSLKDMQFTDFLYSIDNGSNYTTSKGISVSVADGKTYITLVTDDINDTTGANVLVKTSGSVAAKNNFDTKLEILATAGKDYYAPAYTSIVSITTGKGAGYGPSTSTTNMAIDIQYSENLYVPSVQDTDYTVAGYTVGSVEVNGDTVTIYVNDVDASKLPVGTEVKVKQVGEIQDSSLAKNVLGAQNEWTGKVR